MLFLGRAILQAAHQGRGQADRGQRGEVAGASWELAGRANSQLAAQTSRPYL
jgi:hypothetical protein